MREAGFEPEDYEEEPAEVWPDNWLAWRLFMAMSTQWNYLAGGMGTPQRTSLHYPSLYPLLDRECPTTELWWQTFHDLQACEDAALATFREFAKT